MTEKRLRAWPVYLVMLAMWPVSLFASAWVFTIVSVLMVVFGGEVSGAFGEQIERVWETELSKGAPVIALSVGANAIVFTAAPLFLARQDASPERARERLGLESSTIADHALAAIGLLGLTSALDALVQVAGLSDYGRLAEMREVITAVPLEERLPLAFVIGVGAGIPEELFFRGWALRRLAAVHRPAVALLVSSALFGAFHLDFLHAPLAALMGLFLGFVVLRTGSVFPAISAHTINNVVATLSAGLEFPDGLAWPLIFAGAAAASLAAFGVIRRHRGEERPIVW